MKKNNSLLFLILLSVALILVGCQSDEIAKSEDLSVSSVQTTTDGQQSASESGVKTEADKQSSTVEEQGEMKLIININGRDFTATLAENSAVDALIDILSQGSITIEMSDYGGFEKVGALGRDLPTENSQVTTQAGDIVLYQGNQIVMFYGSNSWSYTRLGRIDDLEGWESALGSGSVTVTLSLGS